MRRSGKSEMKNLSFLGPFATIWTKNAQSVGVLIVCIKASIHPNHTNDLTASGI